MERPYAIFYKILNFKFVYFKRILLVIGVVYTSVSSFIWPLRILGESKLSPPSTQKQPLPKIKNHVNKYVFNELYSLNQAEKQKIRNSYRENLWSGQICKIYYSPKRIYPNQLPWFVVERVLRCSRREAVRRIDDLCSVVNFWTGLRADGSCWK